MIVLSAFLHHLAAFTLVATLAIEFVLIRQELTLANARRLTITDIIFGASAGVLLIVGLFACLLFREGRVVLFHQPRISREVCAVRDHWPDLDCARGRVPEVAEVYPGGAGTGGERAKISRIAPDHSLGTGGGRPHPAVCRHDGEGRLDLASIMAGA
jgi:Predicted membrane protein (DUF2214)